MIRLHTITRSLLFAGLATALLAPQDASAFGGVGGRGGVSHSSFGHHDFGGMRVSGGGRISRRPTTTRFPWQRPHLVERTPGRVPPTRIVLPPHRRWPPIFIPPYHRGPHFPPSIIVEAPPRIVPVSVGGTDIAPRVRALRAAAATCATDGSFVSVVFVPTVTAADITAFLKAYNVTMADGPNADGIYRIRLASSVLPPNEVVKVIDAMRTQTAIVSSVDGA